ncbi:MAG: DJ-1/PfpI family protein [Candidatus Rokubacteria bacterium]|nr:DJ-1/PfpI family protein [Candidatus Rokubacteria bacterium]
MQIALALYPGFTALDIIGPFQVLSALPGATCVFVAAEAGPVRDDTRAVELRAALGFAECAEPDVIVVPGGMHTMRCIPDHPILDWLRRTSPKARWTASVCTGSILLAAAGLLKGQRATTHWAAMAALESFGAVPVSERVVFGERIVTAAGVSAGIDMALQLAERLVDKDAAMAAQLAIEYDPAPPFQCGSPKSAPKELVAAVAARLAKAVAPPAR